MARAMDIGGTEWVYILKCDRKLPEEEQTRWHFCQLKHHERRKIEKVSSEGMSIEVQDGNEKNASMKIGDLDGKANCLTLDLALIKVENFYDGASIPIEIIRESSKSRHITDETFERIHPYIGELAAAARRGSMLTEEDEKNF